MSDKPVVIVIDDHPEQTENTFNRDDYACDFESVDVRDLLTKPADPDLRQADVILVDHELVPLKDSLPPLAMNGVALIGVLQQYMDGSENPPLLALYTSDKSIVSSTFTDPNAYTLARTYAFDWAFAKNDVPPMEFSRIIAALANGAALLRDAFGNDPTDQFASIDAEIDKLHHVLGVPDAPWASAAKREISAAQPPIFSRDDGVDPDLVRRWLLHRVFPYPTFLVDTGRAAARLGLTATDFNSVLTSTLGKEFEQARYVGPLAEFTKPQYWRAGIDGIAREIAGGFDTDTLRAALNAASSHELAFTDHARPVLALDSKLGLDSTPVAPSETVRIHVDGWPSYAESPRMLKADAASTEELRNMVIEDDQELLGGGGS